MRAKIFRKAAHFIETGEDITTCWALANALGYKDSKEETESRGGINSIGLNHIKDEEFKLWAEMHKPDDSSYMWFGCTSIPTHQELRQQMLLEAALNLEAQGFADD